MGRLSILGLMLLVLLVALVLGLFLRLRDEAFFYVTGPLLVPAFAAFAYPRDRTALIKGGALGGLCQGVVAILVFKRGYVFQDIAMITGYLYLASLAVQLAAGGGAAHCFTWPSDGLGPNRRRTPPLELDGRRTL